MKRYTSKDLVWIKEIELCRYYIVNGVKPVDVHEFKDGAISMAFIRSETKRLYYEWKIKNGEIDREQCKREKAKQTIDK